ncbi:hypothetical protein L195_g022423 [Trifolium pratense]|uniref:Uncharacterized protein n=1 Tax=Trifolium pratense TaxID=57577 RepID=A0A2K3N826_TRIPR|nr:hypothetical protein L195_g022423 [Trifolium pratense]
MIPPGLCGGTPGGLQDVTIPPHSLASLHACEEEDSIYSEKVLRLYAPSCHDEAHRATMVEAARVSGVHIHRVTMRSIVTRWEKGGQAYF